MARGEACKFCSVAGLAFLAWVAVVVLTCTAGMVQLRVTTSYAVVDCAPPPPPSSAAGNSSRFREKVLPLLAALPAAAAPHGFASLHSDDHSAFVRGICLGFDLEKDCHACLAAAAKNLTDSCLGASRRAGVWRGDSCFVAYADNKTPSAREDAFRHVVFSGEDPGGDPSWFDTRRLVALARSMARHGAAKVDGARAVRNLATLARNRATAENTVRVFPDVARVHTRVRVVAQCARDRAADCARCLGDAARQVPTRSWGLDGWHVRVADVLGYSCFLRVETMVPPLPADTFLSEPLVAVVLSLILSAVMVVGTGFAAAAYGERCCKLRWRGFSSALRCCKLSR